jgi:hypothetical protein
MKRDLSGSVFGRLSVLHESGRDSDRRILWRCMCTCGASVLVSSHHLLRGDVVSCGCKRREAKDPKPRIAESVSIDAESGCWEWRLRKDAGGYGRLKIQMGSRSSFRMEAAHRYAYSIFVGPIPDGMNVLHRCDNPPCCNPDHLFVGTQQDNMRDMHAKGRGPKGYRRDPLVCADNARKRSRIAAAIAGERT